MWRAMPLRGSTFVLFVALACVLRPGASLPLPPNTFTHHTGQQECTVAWNCSDHASAVVGNQQTGCICTCRNQWFGATCLFCPEGIDPKKDCHECDRQYNGYPFCARKCTKEHNCSNHADSVVGDNLVGCQCKCRNQWYGNQCEHCPAGVDAAHDCSRCEHGHEDYPFCGRKCTVDQDCNGRASAVVGNTRTGCKCKCRNQWSGSSCNDCPWNIDSTKDCGQCALGRVNYPFCGLECHNLTNCNNRATSVVGDSVVGCQCKCRNQWTGSTCNECPNGVSRYADCNACWSNYDGFPFCALQCTNFMDCNGNAAEVQGNARTGCLCKCRNRWRGARCDYCPPQYDSVLDCGACAFGFENYPFCTMTSSTSNG